MLVLIFSTLRQVSVKVFRSPPRRPSRRAGAGRRDHQHLAARPGLELVRRAGRDDLALVDDRDVVGELVCLVQVLGGEQHRDPVRDQPADHGPHVGAAPRVQARGRLVQEQHPRLADQAGRQVQPAAHPARVRLGHPGGGVGQVETGQQLGRAGPGLGSRQAQQSADRDEVVRPGQPLVHRRVLAGGPDELPDLVRVAQHVVAADARLPAVRSQQRGQDTDRGRLARPVGPEDPEHPALPGHQVHAVQRRGLAEPLDQASGLDRVRRCRVISHVSMVAHAAVRTRTPRFTAPRDLTAGCAGPPR
jgi:hypothetical protein